MNSGYEVHTTDRNPEAGTKGGTADLNSRSCGLPVENQQGGQITGLIPGPSPPAALVLAECPYQDETAAGSLEPRKHEEHPAKTVQGSAQATGDSLDLLFSELYQELRGMARGMLRDSPPNRTLQPTVLVHEVYLRLCRTFDNHNVNRGYFFGAAAEAMRRIVIEDARRRMTLRRGGRWAKVPLDQLQLAEDATPDILVGIDEALERLSAVFPLQAQVVRLMFFGGMTAAEAGEVLELCDRTVKRHWAFARAWLYNDLSQGA